MKVLAFVDEADISGRDKLSYYELPDALVRRDQFARQVLIRLYIKVCFLVDGVYLLQGEISRLKSKVVDEGILSCLVEPLCYHVKAVSLAGTLPCLEGFIHVLKSLELVRDWWHVHSCSESLLLLYRSVKIKLEDHRVPGQS